MSMEFLISLHESDNSIRRVSIASYSFTLTFDGALCYPADNL